MPAPPGAACGAGRADRSIGQRRDRPAWANVASRLAASGAVRGVLEEIRAPGRAEIAAPGGTWTAWRRVREANPGRTGPPVRATPGAAGCGCGFDRRGRQKRTPARSNTRPSPTGKDFGFRA